MASFSKSYPFAFHVFPLHFARPILQSRQLLSKEDLQDRSRERSTTSRVDRALGFSSLVHTYLAKRATQVRDLSILAAQLSARRDTPFPHAVLRLETEPLSDADCVICNWNIAVSRPGVDGEARGGNWARGTEANVIERIWNLFRDEAPAAKRARGFFHDEWRIPVLVGQQIQPNLKLLSLAPKFPELLLPSPFDIPRGATLHVFDDDEAMLLRPLAKKAGVALEVSAFPGYRHAHVDEDLSREIAEVLIGRRKTLSKSWDWDKVRR